MVAYKVVSPCIILSVLENCAPNLRLVDKVLQCSHYWSEKTLKMFDLHIYAKTNLEGTNPIELHPWPLRKKS